MRRNIKDILFNDAARRGGNKNPGKSLPRRKFLTAGVALATTLACGGAGVVEKTVELVDPENVNEVVTPPEVNTIPTAEGNVSKKANQDVLNGDEGSKAGPAVVRKKEFSERRMGFGKDNRRSFFERDNRGEIEMEQVVCVGKKIDMSGEWIDQEKIWLAEVGEEITRVLRELFPEKGSFFAEVPVYKITRELAEHMEARKSPENERSYVWASFAIFSDNASENLGLPKGVYLNPNYGVNHLQFEGGHSFVSSSTQREVYAHEIVHYVYKLPHYHGEEDSVFSARAVARTVMDHWRTGEYNLMSESERRETKGEVIAGLGAWTKNPGNYPGATVALGEGGEQEA